MGGRREPRAAILALALVGCAAGCAGGPARPPEEEPPAAAPTIPWLADGTPAIEPPDVPWMGGDPITRACPSAWREAPRRSGVACEPWPESGRATCTGPSAHFPGEEGCRTVGAACPAGDFADGLPAGAIHVRPGATGTTGSAADPVGTIAEALALVGTGGTIALARGSHVLDAPIAVPVELRGACAEATRIAGRVRVTAGDVVLRDTALGGLRAEVGLVQVSGVWLDDVAGAAIDVAGGTVRLEDSVVRGGQPDTTGVSLAIRVSVGRLEAARIAIEGALGRGLHLQNRGSVALESSVIQGTRPGSDGWAVGVFTREGAGELAMTRTVVDGGVGALISIEGGTAVLEDVLLRGSTARAGDPFAVGLQSLAASTTIRGIQVRDVAGLGIATAAGHVEVEDAILESTVPGMIGLHSEIDASMTARRVRAGPIGLALNAYTGGELDAADVLVFESTDYALASRGDTSSAIVRRFVAEDCERGTRVGDDASLTLEDAVFRNIASDGLGDDAIGVYLRSVVTARRIVAENVSNSCFAAMQEGASLTLEHASCTGGTRIAMIAAFEGTIDASHLHLADAGLVGIASEGGLVHGQDVLIERIGPAEEVASGADAVAGGEITLERARITTIDGYGSSCAGAADADGRPSRIALTDVAIEDAELGGVVARARAELTRVSIDRPTELGISSGSVEASVRVEDVAVRDVGSRADGHLGFGVHVSEGARLEGTQLVIERARSAGLLVAGAGSTVELTELWVSETAREACGDACPDRAAGSGIVAIEGGAATITGLRSFDHELAGVQIASGGTLDLHDGWVFDNEIGRSVLAPIDPARLTDGVVYLDNAIEESLAPVSVPVSSLF